LTVPKPTPPPTFATVPDYAARLRDALFWAPYVDEVLGRCGLPMEAPLEPGSGGTFPTFLTGRYVVKFFGEPFHGAACYATELAVHLLLSSYPEIPAPRLVDHGHLNGHGSSWPYLITTRIAGTAWHDARLSVVEQLSVAQQLGKVIDQVHRLPVPVGAAWDRDWLADYRAACVDRHRLWGALPPRLVVQIGGFLAAPAPRPVRHLIHADLHDDHLFVNGAALVGVIDWGDTLATDPYYELPPLHLRAFRGDKRLLRAFLDAYGWQVDSDFARRAMTMTLVREFNVLDEVATIVPIEEVATLEELACLLWALP